MGINYLANLIFGIFSLKKGSMRSPNLKRIIASLLFIPFFLLALLINHVFLLFDYLIFPTFLKQQIKKPVFIVSAPRSGTTFLFHKMAEAKTEFTCFKLWEILFAPSITQKYLFLFIRKIDKLFYSPLYRCVLFIEKLLIGKLRKEHFLSLGMPEEDEAVLIWYLCSPFLSFFYEDSNAFWDLNHFDEHVSEKGKKWIMKKYLNLVKRHNFVFNRKGQKQFLSKNPFMMPKLKSLKETFPDAKIITIDRCPLKTIPSALSLCEKLFAMFSSVPMTLKVREESIDLLIFWFHMRDEALLDCYKNDFVRIDFEKLIKWDELELSKISSLVGIYPDVLTAPNFSETTKHKNQTSYPELNTEEIRRISEQLPNMEILCQDLQLEKTR